MNEVEKLTEILSAIILMVIFLIIGLFFGIHLLCLHSILILCEALDAGTFVWTLLAKTITKIVWGIIVARVSIGVANWACDEYLEEADQREE